MPYRNASPSLIQIEELKRRLAELEHTVKAREPQARKPWTLLAGTEVLPWPQEPW